MSLFDAALKIVGLSRAEAADYLKVRPDTINSWCTGRHTPPQGAWDELRTLYALQQRAVDEALDMIDQQIPVVEEVALNSAGPRGKEWPAPGAHLAVLAMIALSVDLRVIDSASDRE